MRLHDFNVAIQKGKNNPGTQTPHQNPAFCQAITLACLGTALRPCLANALPVRQGHGWRVPSPTPPTSAWAARHRAHTKGHSALGCYCCNGPSPITEPRAQSVPVGLPGRCGVFLPPRLVHTHHTVRQVPSQPVCGGIPAGCSSWGISRSAASSRSHPCTQQSLPQHVDYRNLCYEECYAPTSSLCDTATELGSLPINCL